MTHADFITSHLETREAAKLHITAAEGCLRVHHADKSDTAKMTYGQWLDHEAKLQSERHGANWRKWNRTPHGAWSGG